MPSAHKPTRRIRPQTARRAGSRRQLARVQRLLQQHLPELKAQYHIRSLGVFGSYVRGEARKGSDLDVLVDFEQVPSFFEFIALEDRLSELLGIKVDLVMKSALRPRIGRRILAEVVPV